MFIGLNPKTNKYMWVQNGQGNFWLGRDVNDGPGALTPQELMEHAQSIQAQLQRVYPELFPSPDYDLMLAELARKLAAVKAERDKYFATLATIAAHEARPGTAFYTVVQFAKLTIAAAKGE